MQQQWKNGLCKTSKRNTETPYGEPEMKILMKKKDVC